MEKVIYSIDQQTINAKIEALNSAIDFLNTKEAIKKKQNVQTQEELIETYKIKSGFSNVDMILKAFDLESDYNALKDVDFSNLDKYVVLEKGVFKMSENALKDIAEQYTEYLSEEDTAVYHKLMKIGKAMSELGDKTRYLIKTEQGYKVNKIWLKNKM